jgi:hypothetical protein
MGERASLPLNWCQIGMDGSALTAALQLRSVNMVPKLIANRDICSTSLDEGACLRESFAYVVKA